MQLIKKILITLFLKKLTIILITIFGLILIVVSFILFKDNYRNPSLITILPVLGTVLIILFNKPKNLINILLSNTSIVYIGLISYSLYLWHYPIFAFVRIIFEKSDPSFIWVKIFVPIIIILLSIFTYNFVERPFRNKKKILLSPFLKVIILSIILIISLNLISLKTKGYENRMPNILKKQGGIHDRGKLKDANGICDERIENYCNFFENRKRKVFLLNDSQMGAIEFALYNEIKKTEFSFTSITRQSCIYLENFERINIKNKKIDISCSSEVQNKKKQIIDKHANSIIIIGGRYALYLTNKKFNNKEGGIESIEPWQWRFVDKNNNLSLEQGIKQSILNLAKKK